MTATNIYTGSTVMVGSGAPTGTPPFSPALYLDDTGDTWYSWDGSAWTAVAGGGGGGGSHPFTAAATAPATPAAGDHWYDSDVGRHYQRVGTAWVPTARQHALEFSLADYQDQADPLAAALAAMAAAWPGPEPGDWWWGAGNDPSNRFVCHVPPGKWGVVTTAYNVTVPVTFRGPATNAGRTTAGAMLSGDFTIGTPTRTVSVSFEDLYIEGIHTLQAFRSDEVRVERCWLIDDTTFGGRGTNEPFFTCNGGGTVTIRDTNVYSSDDRYLVGLNAHYDAVRLERVSTRYGIVSATAASGGIYLRECSGGGFSNAYTIDIASTLGIALIVTDSDLAAPACRVQVPSGTGESILRFERNRVGGTGPGTPNVHVTSIGSSSVRSFEEIIVTGNVFFGGSITASSCASVVLALQSGAGAPDATVRITDNVCGFSADGRAIRAEMSGAGTTSSALVRGNVVGSANSTTQAPIDVRNFGMATITDNQVYTGGITHKAVETTDCARGVIALNSTTSGGTFVAAGTTSVLVVNNA